MRHTALIIAVLFVSLFTHAQQMQHKIIYDLNSSDTAVHSTVIRQFNNILKAAPDAQIELVCHGPAIYMMVQNKAFLTEKMKELKTKGNVRFTVCANSMKRLNVDKTELLELAEIVPIAILELSSKQAEGWSYIKAGN